MGPLPSCWCSGVQKVLNGPGTVRESEAAPLPGPPVEDGKEAGVAEGDPGGVQDKAGAAVFGRRGQQCPQRGGAEVVDLSGEAEDQGGAEGVQESTTMTPGAVSAPESCTTGGAGVARAADSIGPALEVLTSPSTPPARGRGTSHAPLSPHVTSTDPRQGGKIPPERGRRTPTTRPLSSGIAGTAPSGTGCEGKRLPGHPADWRLR